MTSKTGLRDHILGEIRRLTSLNGGRPPGRALFEKTTGIRGSQWLGVYWARWGDALVEAGFAPNEKQTRINAKFILQKLAEASRHYGKMPSYAELRMYRKIDRTFPAHSTFNLHFHTKEEMLQQLRMWLSQNDGYPDVEAMLPNSKTNIAPIGVGKISEGWVYLIRWGAHYKIGRSDQLEQRVKQVQTSLPEKGDLVHAIKTDDPVGIESYWHRRFADQRAKGEWFKLSTQHVAAFKRRKFQ